MRAMQANVGGDRNTKLCQVRLDRIQILAQTKKARLPAISGFRIMWDSFVRKPEPPADGAKTGNRADADRKG